MSSLFSSLLGSISELPWIAIIAISGGFLVAIVGMVSGIWAAQRRQQMWHETARIALEKGQPLPPSHDDEGKTIEPPKRSRHSDIRSGLILLGVGAGLYLFLGALVGRGLGLVGAIPGFIGVALLLFGLVNALTQPKDPPAA